MATKVGIIRALLYYRFYPLWKTFFNSLGAEVVLSSPTNKRILEEGKKRAVSDACLPTKVALGHVWELKDRVDYLFLPRIVSLERDAYMCPKFLAFPDVVRNCFRDLPPVLDTNFNARKKDARHSLYHTGRIFSRSPLQVNLALKEAISQQERFTKLLRTGILPLEAIKSFESNWRGSSRRKIPNPPLRIALIGHPYNIYDTYVNFNLISKLEAHGASIIGIETLPQRIIQDRASSLPRKPYWSSAREVVGAAFYFLEADRVEGMINVMSFGCGPSSLLGEVIALRAKDYPQIPYLPLVIDEHTDSAGITVRVETFIDMIKYRKRVEV